MKVYRCNTCDYACVETRFKPGYCKRTGKNVEWKETNFVDLRVLLSLKTFVHYVEQESFKKDDRSFWIMGGDKFKYE